MNYYVLDSNNEIALFDTDKSRIQTTLKFKPELAEAKILQTEREIVELDGKFVFADEHTNELLEKAKADKLSQLKAISQKFTVNDCEEMYLTSSLGYAINADKTAQDNIRGLIEAHEETDLIKYKLYDNSFREVTIADLKIMLKECAQNGENLYTQKFLYQTQISACTSIDEVNAIEIVFEMMDFSKSDTETHSE